MCKTDYETRVKRKHKAGLIQNKFTESEERLTSYELEMLQILAVGQLNVIWGHVKNAIHVRTALGRAWTKLNLPVVSPEGVYKPKRRYKHGYS